MNKQEIDIEFYEGLQKKGALFIVFDDQHHLTAEISEIKKFEKYQGIDRIPFSVIFLVKEKNIYWQQGIYKIIYSEQENIEVFLVPIGLVEEGMRYEAVYS
jgi:hypothetical protein